MGTRKNGRDGVKGKKKTDYVKEGEIRNEGE
jgi:hypothetical protein